MKTNSGILLAVFGLAASALTMGCESTAPGATAPSAQPDKGTTTAGSKSSAAPTVTAAVTASASAAAKPQDAPKVELVDKDLSTAGAVWKGWVMKAPADADVMGDLSGVRIVTKKAIGPGSFDLAFKLGKQNLKELKTNLEKGAAAAKTTVTFTVDTPEALEWTITAGSAKTYDFSLIQKTGGKDVTCYTVTARESEAEIAALKEACKRLEKK